MEYHASLEGEQAVGVEANGVEDALYLAVGMVGGELTQADQRGAIRLRAAHAANRARVACTAVTSEPGEVADRKW
jgi:hypothetical protein